MECITGGPNINWIIKRKDQLPKEREIETVKIFQKICTAIAYLHSKGIVHRDIKFDNILALEETK